MDTAARARGVIWMQDSTVKILFPQAPFFRNLPTSWCVCVGGGLTAPSSCTYFLSSCTELPILCFHELPWLPPPHAPSPCGLHLQHLTSSASWSSWLFLHLLSPLTRKLLKSGAPVLLTTCNQRAVMWGGRVPEGNDGIEIALCPHLQYLGDSHSRSRDWQILGNFWKSNRKYSNTHVNTKNVYIVSIF